MYTGLAIQIYWVHKYRLVQLLRRNDRFHFVSKSCFHFASKETLGFKTNIFASKETFHISPQKLFPFRLKRNIRFLFGTNSPPPHKLRCRTERGRKNHRLQKQCECEENKSKVRKNVSINERGGRRTNTDVNLDLIHSYSLQIRIAARN